jgi:hypothetical protein
MTIKDYRPKDYVWFDHKQATDTRKTRPAIILRVFPEHERVVLIYGQSKPWPDALRVPAGPESPVPGDTYFGPTNVCAVTMPSLRRVTVPPKTCKSRRFFELEALSQRHVRALLIAEDLEVLGEPMPAVKDDR